MNKITGAYYNDGQDGYTVDQNGITRIEQTEKKGHYDMLPYIAVYAGDTLVAEMCQHNITLVVFNHGRACEAR
jgi:hypothetical protein